MAKKKKIGDILDNVRELISEKNLDTDSLTDLLLEYLEEYGDPEDFENFLQQEVEEDDLEDTFDNLTKDDD